MPEYQRRRLPLVVEDDRDLRELYRRTLILSGYEAVGVGDGIDALRWIESEIPDLVVLDIGLPLLDGRDVARELRARAATRDIPIVAVTGMDDRNLKVPEFSCVLHKPVFPDALVRAVRDCLNSHGSRPAW